MEFSRHFCKQCNKELFYGEPTYYERGVQDENVILLQIDKENKAALERDLEILRGEKYELKVSEGSFCHYCKDPMSGEYSFMCKLHTVLVTDERLSLSCCSKCVSVAEKEGFRELTVEDL